MPDFIDVSPQPPHADFTNITPTTGDKAPFTVTFTDTSTNDPDAWSWTFGDGSSSTSQNPTHAYAANGTFTVTLVATNRSTGSKGITKTNYISVGLQYVETYGPYTVLKFNNTGTTTWMPPQGVTQVDYLVVAGGGEGGNGGTIGSEDYPGGGGGGGGVKNGSTPVAGLQTIIVGQGGSGTAGSIPQGAQGGNSVFGTITAFGGGAGAGNCFSNCSAGAGGSGGGGSGMGSAGGNGTEGQGYAGGAGNYTLPGNPAGGGGGAGAAGATPGLSPIGVNRGDGGNGRPIDITGTATYYGGGGGGGIGFGDAYGLGGAGCGGDGSRETANNAKCQATGGGGGGAGGGNLSHGSGGSGVVIIRYPTSSPLRANFTAIPRAGPAPLAVQFTDASTGGPASWNWDFGDGDPTNATDQNPVHTYLTNGSFTVNLTVSTDGSPSNKTIKVRFINVGMQDKIGVFRPSTHIFYQDYNGNGAWNGATIDRSYSFGISGDTPMTGDWNNDGTTEIGVFRNSTHLFYQDYNGDGAWSGSLTDRSFNFGATGDTPITGDWNNDGITEIGIYRNSTNQFYQDYNGNGVWNGALIDRVFSFGISGDTPITGDWNNDGITEIGVFRNSTAMYYQDYNGNGAWNGGTIDRSYVFGMAGDLPVAGRW